MTFLLIYLACMIATVIGIYIFGSWYLGPEEPLE